MLAGGCVLGAAIVLLRHPLADLVTGGASGPVARSLVPLGIVLPAGLDAAVRDADAQRRVQPRPPPRARGLRGRRGRQRACVLLALAGSSPDVAGAAASSVSICVTLAILVAPFRRLLERAADR